ncbi:hypothetical protein F4804DRAFT_324968 [Jackrogersella minutella]|nr:hypothetical protein F4804DRAFT_324968 [Jackrogersella minutella]
MGLLSFAFWFPCFFVFFPMFTLGGFYLHTEGGPRIYGPVANHCSWVVALEGHVRRFGVRRSGADLRGSRAACMHIYGHHRRARMLSIVMALRAFNGVFFGFALVPRWGRL